MGEGVGLVQCMKFDLFKRIVVPREVIKVIPPHGVHICEAYLVTESGMVLIKKAKAILNSKEILLLDDLSIDLRRPYSLNLGD